MKITATAERFIKGKNFNRLADYVSSTHYTDNSEAWIYEGTAIAKRLNGTVYITEYSRYINMDKVIRGIIDFNSILTDNPCINRTYAVIIACKLYNVPCFTADCVDCNVLLNGNN